jgi:hypothetical protein
MSVTGDDLLAYWGKPDFIKIDIEGAEVAALNGCSRVLLEARPSLYIEVSPENAETATRQMKHFGYDIFHLNGDGSETRVELCSFYTVARPQVS